MTAAQSAIEAEKMRRVPGIFFVTDAGERQPWIRGTGLEVVEIIWVYRNCDWDRDALRKAFDWLSEEQLQAALDYYAAYPDEVNAALAQYDAFGVEDLWREYPETKPRSAT